MYEAPPRLPYKKKLNVCRRKSSEERILNLMHTQFDFALRRQALTQTQLIQQRLGQKAVRGVFLARRSLAPETTEVALDKVILWTDASTVLQWLNSGVTLSMFVQNQALGNLMRTQSDFALMYPPTQTQLIATFGSKASLLKHSERDLFGL